MTGDWIGQALQNLTAHLPHEEQLSTLQELQTSRLIDLSDGYIHFAVLLPITSRGSNSKENCLRDLVSFSHSLVATTYKDTHGMGVVPFRFTIYLSIDHDDHFLLGSEWRAEAALGTAGITDIVTIVANHEKGHICAHWRDCARRAFKDGCDYFTLLGDDVTLKDQGWMRRVHEEFQRF